MQVRHIQSNKLSCDKSIIIIIIKVDEIPASIVPIYFQGLSCNISELGTKWR
jgi:hypothetical protein